MAFSRYLATENIVALKQEQLFERFLMRDIVKTFSQKELNQDVFPAVRQGRIDFYHRGGKLFSYEGTDGFYTHQKYASVLACSKDDYVKEKHLRKIKAITSFCEQVEGESERFVYERIKENCALYAGNEAEAVSRLYNRYSCAKAKRGDEIVVLDIEVSFKNLNDESPDVDRNRTKQDRVDLVLFHTRTKKLRFVEAKQFSNDELRAKTGKPKVVAQMERYRSQLDTEEKREHILHQYQKHVDVINQLLSASLPQPEDVDPEPCLYVFGFDDDQKKGRLSSNLATLRSMGVKVYAKGDPTTVEIRALWQRATSK